MKGLPHNFIYTFAHLFNKYVTVYVPGTILETRDSAMSKTNKKITPTVSVGETDNKQDK